MLITGVCQKRFSWFWALWVLFFPPLCFPFCHTWLLPTCQIPSAPVSEDDYSLARSRSSPHSSRSSEQYHGLMALLRKQHEVRPRPLLPSTGSLPVFSFSSISISMFVCFLLFEPHGCELFVFTRHVIASLSHADTFFFFHNLQKCLACTQQFVVLGSVPEALK